MVLCTGVTTGVTTAPCPWTTLFEYADTPVGTLDTIEPTWAARILKQEEKIACAQKNKQTNQNKYQKGPERECQIEYLRCEYTSGAGWTILVTAGAASKVGAYKLGLAAANAKRADKTI